MMNNMGDMMKKAQKMQEEMQKAQEEIAKAEVTGEAGAGEVIVHMNAKHNVSRIELSDTVIKEPKEVLEELIAAAFNNAAAKVENVSKEKMMDMSSLLGGMMGGNKDIKEDDDK